jgi:hypothetical protein
MTRLVTSGVLFYVRVRVGVRVRVRVRVGVRVRVRVRVRYDTLGDKRTAILR